MYGRTCMLSTHTCMRVNSCAGTLHAYLVYACAQTHTQDTGTGHRHRHRYRYTQTQAQTGKHARTHARTHAHARAHTPTHTQLGLAAEPAFTMFPMPCERSRTIALGGWWVHVCGVCIYPMCCAEGLRGPECPGPNPPRADARGCLVGFTRALVLCPTQSPLFGTWGCKGLRGT